MGGRGCRGEGKGGSGQWEEAGKGERDGIMNLRQQAPHQKNFHPMMETTQSSTFAHTNRLYG